MITEEHIQKFLEQAHRVGDAALTICSSGNLSWRIGDEALVSGTGSWVPSLQKEKVSQCLVATGEVLNGVKPSMESGFHLGVLRERPDCDVVLHFQSPFATAVACIKEKLYHYRLHPASIMHGKVTLKNLDEIDANYGLLACALKYGKKDTAFLQYVLMKRMLRNTKKNLPPKQRNSERVQQAEACLKKAGREVRQQGACTLRNAAETALCIANPQFYFNFKYRK